MSQPTWTGSHNRAIAAHLDSNSRKIADCLLEALRESKTGNSEANERAILQAMTINADSERIQRLVADGKADEALTIVMQKKRLKPGNNGNHD